MWRLEKAGKRSADHGWWPAAVKHPSWVISDSSSGNLLKVFHALDCLPLLPLLDTQCVLTDNLVTLAEVQIPRSPPGFFLTRNWKDYYTYLLFNVHARAQCRLFVFFWLVKNKKIFKCWPHVSHLTACSLHNGLHKNSSHPAFYTSPRVSSNISYPFDKRLYSHLSAVCRTSVTSVLRSRSMTSRPKIQVSCTKNYMQSYSKQSIILIGGRDTGTSILLVH